MDVVQTEKQNDEKIVFPPILGCLVASAGCHASLALAYFLWNKTTQGHELIIFHTPTLRTFRDKFFGALLGSTSALMIVASAAIWIFLATRGTLPKHEQTWIAVYNINGPVGMSSFFRSIACALDKGVTKILQSRIGLILLGFLVVFAMTITAGWGIFCYIYPERAMLLVYFGLYFLGSSCFIYAVISAAFRNRYVFFLMNKTAHLWSPVRVFKLHATLNRPANFGIFCQQHLIPLIRKVSLKNSFKFLANLEFGDFARTFVTALLCTLSLPLIYVLFFLMRTFDLRVVHFLTFPIAHLLSWICFFIIFMADFIGLIFIFVTKLTSLAVAVAMGFSIFFINSMLFFTLRTFWGALGPLVLGFIFMCYFSAMLVWILLIYNISLQSKTLYDIRETGKFLVAAFRNRKDVVQKISFSVAMIVCLMMMGAGLQYVHRLSNEHQIAMTLSQSLSKAKLYLVEKPYQHLQRETPAEIRVSIEASLETLRAKALPKKPSQKPNLESKIDGTL